MSEPVDGMRANQEQGRFEVLHDGEWHAISVISHGGPGDPDEVFVHGKALRVP